MNLNKRNKSKIWERKDIYYFSNSFVYKIINKMIIIIKKKSINKFYSKTSSGIPDFKVQVDPWDVANSFNILL